MPLEDIYISCNFRKDEELNMMHGYGDISIFKSDKTVSVGSIYFNFYNVYEFDELRDLLIIADEISGDEIYMISELMENGLENGGKLITLDRIILKDEYASAEREDLILNCFLDYCGYMMFDYVLTIASKPLSENKKGKGILDFPQIKLFQKYNFKVIGGSERQAPVMLKNLNFYG